MYDHGPQKYSRDALEESSLAMKEAERRTGGRYTFAATAEVIFPSSGVRLSTRTTDLGLGGCFVDTLTPVPIGAKVQVTIWKDKAQLTANGLVVYSQHGLGMGIAFEELPPPQRQVLDGWLAELMSGSQRQRDAAHAPKKPEQSAAVSNREALNRLIRLLLEKGVLTIAESNSILNDRIL